MITSNFRSSVIVDDCSTDRTREIMLSCADPCIRLFENERNLRLAASLNRGLRLTGRLHVQSRLSEWLRRLPGRPLILPRGTDS